MTVATVIVPTHEHASTLPLAVESVLAQTVAELEVIVIGDGPDDDTREAAVALARCDERVTYVDHPKGTRHGEVYRHEALAEARGRIVGYLSDDDLWLPDHVETMDALLCDADFAHALPIMVHVDGTWVTLGVDLRELFWRDRIRRVENRVPLSCAAHTLAAYRRLPFGWRPAPPDVFTDLNMWRQFLEQPGLRFVSGSAATVVHFPSHWRHDMNAAERFTELETWAQRLATPDGRARFRARTADRIVSERSGWESHGLGLEHHVAHLERVLEDRCAEVEHLRGVERKVADVYMRLQAMHDLAARRYAVMEAQGARLDALEARRAELASSVRDLEAGRAMLQRELDATRSTVTWRARERLLHVPAVGAGLRRRAALRARRGGR